MSVRTNAAYVAGSRGGENGCPGLDAAQFGVRTTSPSTSMRLRAAAATLRSIAANSNWPCRGSTRSHAISKRSDSTPERRMFALSAPRFTAGVSSTPLTMTPKKPDGVARAAAAPGAARASAAAKSAASRATRRMAAILPGRSREKRRRVGAQRARRRVRPRPARLGDLGVGEHDRRPAGRRLEAVQQRRLVAAGDLEAGDRAHAGEPDPELLAHLAPDRRLGVLAPAHAAARQLPRRPVAVGTAHEQDPPGVVADDALHAP